VSEEIIAFLKANLRIDTKEESVYTGAMDGPLYEQQITIQLVLCDEVISEVSL